MFLRKKIGKSTTDCWKEIEKLEKQIQQADAIIIGAGAGLSTSAGFHYAGERFKEYFGDFANRYHFIDMYSGGFYPYETLEEHWAYWSRYIYINRYMDAPNPVYNNLYSRVKEKDYFVLTTNVDHCFQKAGFDKHRLFYTQGDYGLFQCSEPCHQNTYNNEAVIRKMVEAQGYRVDGNGRLVVPESRQPERKIPSELVPHCPKCGKPMSMNLRADGTFIQDEGWYAASNRYYEFLKRAYWSRYIYINRYMDAPNPVYNNLYSRVKEKDYFVLTTNVDHCFQKAGFDKHRLFYTQGDYGLFQCSEPCHQNTYNNEAVIRKMVEAQGYRVDGNGRLVVPESRQPERKIPSELVPHCPKCGKPMSMNLRADGTFIQDEGWYAASNRYYEFLKRHENLFILFLELGVGENTPAIIKYPFWRMTAENPKAVYACINWGQAYAPKEISERSICIDQDIGEVLGKIIKDNV